MSNCFQSGCTFLFSYFHCTGVLVSPRADDTCQYQSLFLFLVTLCVWNDIICGFNFNLPEIKINFCLWVICICHFNKCLFKSFAHLKKWSCFLFLVLIYKSSFCVPDRSFFVICTHFFFVVCDLLVQFLNGDFWLTEF